MPIGSSKIGVMGGETPGGSAVFTSPGTFCAPSGLQKISVSGTGGAGVQGFYR